MTQQATPQPLLRIDNLQVRYPHQQDPALVDIHLSVAPGEVVALVGESGSGKSTLANSILQLLPVGSQLTGTVELANTNLVGLSKAQLRQVHGAQLGLVPQDPGTSLNPVKTIGSQLAEVFRLHPEQGQPKPTAAELKTRCIELLGLVGIDRPSERLGQYPHELSGGLKQRVLIAMAFALRPKLLIADEPTSALDVTVQQRVLEVFDRLRKEFGTAVIFVTHDIALAADHSDRIAVMRHGKILEVQKTRELLADPGHTYTRELLKEATAQHIRVRFHDVIQPLLEEQRGLRPPAIEVRNLVKTFGDAGSERRAVDGVSFSVPPGSTFALVGESGSGKSTTARMIMRLLDADSGQVLINGKDVTTATGEAKRSLWRQLQLVYQNPDSALDPRLSLEEIIGAPLRNYRVGDKHTRHSRVRELLDQVSLPAHFTQARPGELSGGQRQRVAIARALALGAETLVLDEALSALDVLTQASILTLLEELQEQQGLSYLFISHDLHIVERIADHVGVMCAGELVEQGTQKAVFETPQHRYTQQLLAARPGEVLLNHQQKVTTP